MSKFIESHSNASIFGEIIVVVIVTNNFSIISSSFEYRAPG